MKNFLQKPPQDRLEFCGQTYAASTYTENKITLLFFFCHEHFDNDERRKINLKSILSLFGNHLSAAFFLQV